MSNPYLDLLNDDKDKQEGNPYLSLIDAEEPDQTTAVGRRQADYESRSRLVQTAAEALKKAGISEQRKATLQHIIDRNKPISDFGVAGENSDVGSIHRFLGGAVGAIPALGMSAADLILAAPAKLGVGIAKAGRKRLAEGQASLTELTGAEGIEGLAGNLVGGAVAGTAIRAVSAAPGAIGAAARVAGAPAELFGRVAQGTLGAAGRVSPTVARLADKALTGNVVERIGANVVGGLPINVAQALSLDDATLGDRARTLALGIAGDIAAGALPTKLPTRRSAVAETAAAAPPTGPKADAAGELIKAGEVKAAERKAARALEQEGRIKAREEWAAANPGKSWKDDLSKNQRRDFIDEWKARTTGGALDGTAEVSPVVEVPGSDPQADRIADLERRLTEAQYTDQALTGLGNKAGHKIFTDKIASGEVKGDFEHVVIDLANFKGINDTQGHPAGDATLKRVADAMQAAAESIGITSRNVFRLGGDEFAGVVPKGMGEAFGQKVKEIVGSHEVVPGKHFGVDYAVGKDFATADNAVLEIKKARSEAGGSLRPMTTADAAVANSQQEQPITRTESVAGGFEVKMVVGDKQIGRLAAQFLSPDEAAVFDIFIEPEFRGKKLSTKLFEEAAKQSNLYGGLTSVTAEGAQASKSAAKKGLVKNVFEYAIGPVDSWTDDQISSVVTKLKKHGASNKAIETWLDSNGIPVANSQQRAPGVPADAPPTVAIFKTVDELGLSDVVGSAFRTRLAQAPDEAPHIQAELAARNTLDSFNEHTAAGMTPDQARAAIMAEHAQVMADPMVPKPGLDEAGAGSFDQTAFGTSTGEANSIPSPEGRPSTPGDPLAAQPVAPQGSTPRKLKSWPDGPDLESITIVDEDNAPRGTHSIDSLKDFVLNKMEEHPPGQAPPQLYQDLDAIVARQKQIEATARQSPENPTGEAPILAPADTPAKKAQAVKPLLGKEFLELLRTPADKMNPVDGQRMLTELNRRVAMLHGDDLSSAPYVRKMNEIREALIDKTSPKKDGGAIVLNTRREIGGAIAGYFGGSMLGDTDEERARYAITGALIGAGVAHGAPKFFKPTQRASLVPKETLSIVKSNADIKEGRKVSSFLERARQIYWERVRYANGMEAAVQGMTGGKKLAVEKDPGKMAAMFGRWIARSEEWLTGTPVIEDVDGNIIELPPLTYAKADGTPVVVRNAHDIAKLVDGDTEGLGKLAAARSALELYGSQGRKTPGIDLIEAQRLWANMPEEYHLAADAMRDMHKALVYAETAAGLHTPEEAIKITAERYYAAMEKAFDSPIHEGDVDAKGQQVIGSPTSVKGRKLGTLAPIKNPFETFLAHIGRAQRAIEINQIKNRLIDLVDANPEIGHLYAKRIDKNYKGPDNKPLVNDQTDARVEILAHELGISRDHAAKIVVAHGGDKLDPSAPVMTIFRDGAKRTYKLNRGVAATLKAFHPDEISLFWQMAGAPTKWARTGIVNNPVFIARQAWRDNWQAMMNSQYGFRWGLDWIGGYIELMKNGKHAKEFTKAGGGSTGFALRDVLSADKSLQHVKTPGKNPIDTAILRVKELSIPEAWHALVTPMAEASRMGEFLRARGRGASPVEAAYAAKQVVGNFQQHGTKMRGFANAALFLNPALQAMDQTMFVAGVHPFRGAPEGKTRTGAALTYAAKGTAIGLTSALFWAANRGDDEINELRKAESGRGFWFWRDGKGELHKTAKPIFEGQLFGTTMEMALDKFLTDDPESANAWVNSMLRDASVNLLPVAGVVPASLWANKDVNSGGQIAPEGQGDPQFAARSSTSQPARVIGDALGPVSKWLMDQTQGGVMETSGQTLARAMSPAGIDYLVRNLGGTLASEAMLGVTQAVQYQETGYVPAKEELPLIRGAMVRYPNSYTASIQEFYHNAERIERVAQSFAALAKKDPPGALQYYKENKADVTKIELYSKVRSELADLRQSIEDLKQAPVGSFDLQAIKDFEKQATLRMIALAKQANAAAKSIQ